MARPLTSLRDARVAVYGAVRRYERSVSLALRASRVDWRSALEAPGSNCFIGGITGRTGTSWLNRLVGEALRGRIAAIGEHGVFVLGQFRNAGYEFYQVARGAPARKAYLEYFGSFVLRCAYDRHRIYGLGGYGFRHWMPRRPIRAALKLLRAEALEAATLAESQQCFGRFYSRLMSVAAVLEAGTLDWVSKEPPYGRHARELYEMIPDCRLAVLLRDGRDTALSMARRGWHEGDVRACMDRWRVFSELTLASLAQVPEENFLRLKYEDLLDDVAGELERVLRFFGYGPEGLDLDRSRLEQPLKGNKSKWMEALDAGTRAYFDRTCGELSARLGYE